VQCAIAFMVLQIRVSPFSQKEFKDFIHLSYSRDVQWCFSSRIILLVDISPVSHQNIYDFANLRLLPVKVVFTFISYSPIVTGNRQHRVALAICPVDVSPFSYSMLH